MFTRYVLPVFSVIALGFAVFQMTKAQHKTPPAAPPIEPAQSPYQHPLAGAGIIEPETENIAIGSETAGVVERVNVKVGDTVRPGQPLFRLDDRKLQAELHVRQATLAGAEASLRKLREMPRPEEVPPQEAKVEEAKANLQDAQQMFNRVAELRPTQAVSQEEYTRRKQGLAIAQAQLLRAQKDLALLKRGAWEPDVQIAEATVRQAKAQAAQTKTELDRLTVRAPRMKWPTSLIDADDTKFKVLQVNVRPGEYVGTVGGQAMIVLGYVGKLHVRVDIDENEIGRFHPGMPGVAKPRGAGPEQPFLPLTFVRVEPYVIPKKSLTGSNTERVDTRVLQVIYAIQTKGQPLYVGQQVDVFLDAK